jgi:diguanylate cyclase (GGDEF)-like protein/PAS domain S-box-containing protein
MVDPEAIWRPETGGRSEPPAYAVLVTDAIAGTADAWPSIRRVDSGFARMTGYTAETVRGLAFDTLAGARTDRERLATACERLAAGRPDAGATVHYRRDGSPLGIAWSVEPVCVDAARVTHFVWILHEIAVDRAATEGDDAAPAPSALLVGATGADGRGRIVHASEAFSTLTGYGPDAVPGQGGAVLQGDAGPEGERERLRRALAGGWSCRVELLQYTRAGRPFWNVLDVMPFDHEDVGTAYWLGLAHDVTEARDREQRRYEAAYYDDLTGLPNRALAQARVERAIRTAHRNRGRVALLYIDLDGFDAQRARVSRPELNDCLSRLATRFADATRRSDTLAYIGGDEFLVVAEDIATAADSRDIAARLCRVAGDPIRVGRERASLGASVGISIYPDHGGDPEQLLQRADTALVQARADGEAIGVYSPTRMGARLERVCTDDELRGAIRRDEFAVALQPVVALADGHVFAHEAFARWHHPREGWIPPLDFLPLVFGRGNAALISERVQALAFSALALWWTVLPEPLPRIILNVDHAELLTEGFASGLLERLAGERLPPAAVELDLGPDLLRRASDADLASLRRLQTAGVTLALDQCQHPEDVTPLLHRLQLDRLKLAGSLVRDAHLDPTRRDLVARLIAVAAEHGLATAAVGVETAEEAEYLAGIGCAAAQGYRFGRPEII